MQSWQWRARVRDEDQLKWTNWKFTKEAKKEILFAAREKIDSFLQITFSALFNIELYTSVKQLLSHVKCDNCAAKINRIKSPNIKNTHFKIRLRL